MTGSGGSSAEPGNPWRWHAEADPYRDSAFGVLGIRPSTVLRRAHASSRRQQVRYGTVHHLGQEVDEAAINAAEQRLRDPAGRVLETLRSHEVEPAAVDTADLAADLAEVLERDVGDEPDTSVELDRETLLGLVPPARPRHIPPLPPLRPIGLEDFA